MANTTNPTTGGDSQHPSNPLGGVSTMSIPDAWGNQQFTDSTLSQENLADETSTSFARPQFTGKLSQGDLAS